MKGSKRAGRRVKVSADGEGVVSHAGVGLLREMAEETGLVEALADTYQGPWLHPPGQVFTDIAVAVADGADAISGIEVLGDRQDCSVRWRRCRRRGGCWMGSRRPGWTG